MPLTTGGTILLTNAGSDNAKKAVIEAMAIDVDSRTSCDLGGEIAIAIDGYYSPRDDVRRLGTALSMITAGSYVHPMDVAGEPGVVQAGQDDGKLSDDEHGMIINEPLAAPSSQHRVCAERTAESRLAFQLKLMRTHHACFTSQ